MASQLRKLRRARTAPAALLEHGSGSIMFNDRDLIVYGAGCAWWDSIDKAGRRSGGGMPLPCCPHCGSVLMQTSESDWWSGAAKQDAEQPGYLDTLRWSRGRCFKTWAEAKAAHAAELEDRRG